MKKMTKLTALVLALLLALSLTGCADDHEKMVGVWETEVEFAQVFNNALGNAENAEYLKVDSLKLKMVLTFREDSTYSMVADPASVDAAMAGLRQTLKDGMEAYLVDTVAATGLNLGINDIMDMLNTDLNTLVDQVLTPELIGSVTGIMDAEGQYLAEHGKLYLSDSPDKEIDETVYETYILEEKNNKLILVTPNTTDAYTDLLYPLEFTAVTEE